MSLLPELTTPGYNPRSIQHVRQGSNHNVPTIDALTLRKRQLESKRQGSLTTRNTRLHRTPTTLAALTDRSHHHEFPEIMKREKQRGREDVTNERAPSSEGKRSTIWPAPPDASHRPVRPVGTPNGSRRPHHSTHHASAEHMERDRAHRWQRERERDRLEPRHVKNKTSLIMMIPLTEVSADGIPQPSASIKELEEKNKRAAKERLLQLKQQRAKRHLLQDDNNENNTSQQQPSSTSESTSDDSYPTHPLSPTRHELIQRYKSRKKRHSQDMDMMIDDGKTTILEATPPVEPKPDVDDGRRRRRSHRPVRRTHTDETTTTTTTTTDTSTTTDTELSPTSTAIIAVNPLSPPSHWNEEDKRRYRQELISKYKAKKRASQAATSPSPPQPTKHIGDDEHQEQQQMQDHVMEQDETPTIIESDGNIHDIPNSPSSISQPPHDDHYRRLHTKILTSPHRKSLTQRVQEQQARTHIPHLDIQRTHSNIPHLDIQRTHSNSTYLDIQRTSSNSMSEKSSSTPRSYDSTPRIEMETSRNDVELVEDESTPPHVYRRSRVSVNKSSHHITS